MRKSSEKEYKKKLKKFENLADQFMGSAGLKERFDAAFALATKF
mgnify:CR=1 FL=1